METFSRCSLITYLAISERIARHDVINWRKSFVKELIKMMRLEIEGEPIPAARPRFSGRRTYQPKRNMEYRLRVQEVSRAAMDGREPMTGEIVIEVKLYRKYKRTARIYGDVDNHLKAISTG